MDKKGEHYKFEGASRVADLISNELWSSKAISQDQEAPRVVTSRLKPKDMEKIFFIY